MYRIILQPVAFEWRDSLHVNFVQLHVYMNIKVYSVSYLNNYIVFFNIVIVFFIIFCPLAAVANKCSRLILILNRL